VSPTGTDRTRFPLSSFLHGSEYSFYSIELKESKASTINIVGCLPTRLAEMSTANSPVSDRMLHQLPTNWAGRNSQAHVVQFYREDQSLIDALSRIVGTAVGAGDSAIVIATEGHRQALARKLKSRGFDAEAALTQGRIQQRAGHKNISNTMIYTHVSDQQASDACRESLMTAFA
jgi:DcmR-like sensory protein